MDVFVGAFFEDGKLRRGETRNKKINQIFDCVESKIEREDALINE